MTMPIHYSDGTTVQAVVAIWDDLHIQVPGFYRAFWVDEKDVEGNGSPVIGYCDSRPGSFRTIRAAVADVRQMYPSVPVYRNGRLIAA